ncbi:putative KR domain containing protein [Lyophyllum shimeji]|uniref:KR domain containing protein n=1 Tax=Lyophyllum shimeji TaxID=47721 RepID=A0A9P3PR30_LYOSH|nr:putative KR domain containing protein [Lyophyllum shimeji]
MVSLSEAKAINATYTPRYTPTAIFAGGTSGIGRAMAAHLARTTHGACNIVLVGRNRAAAEALFASLPTGTGKEYMRAFVRCDVSRMKNVRAAAGELRARLEREHVNLNFLVLTTGVLRFSGRRETEEGIDEKLALVYYSRFVWIQELVPLLEKVAGEGQDAKVMSVLAAGALAERVDLDDLGLARRYGGVKAMKVAPTYNDLMLEKFAALHPTVSFTHAFPGTVLTPILFPSSFPWKLLNPLLYVLYWFFAVSPDECAEYMWCALHTVGPGFHRRGERAQDQDWKNYYGSDEAREKLWEHTREVTQTTTD